MDIISQNLFTSLPFSPEALSNWNENIDRDLLEFIYKVYDKQGIVVKEDGSRISINHKDTVIYFYLNYRQIFQEWIKRVTLTAGQFNELIPNLIDDPEFGKVGKYFIAWNCLIRYIRAEALFFCIDHINETISEINSSMYLVSGFYYKQGLEVLRNFLEEVVKPIYFCINEAAYKNWRLNRFQHLQMHSYRDKKGIINTLLEKTIIDKDIAKEFSDLYKELSGCVHGEKKWFSSSNFSYERLCKWNDLFCRSINLAIKLVIININEWQRQKLKNIDEKVCLYCHNKHKILVNRIIEHGEEIYLEQKCSQCNQVMIIRKSQPVFKVTVSNDDGIEENYFFLNR